MNEMRVFLSKIQLAVLLVFTTGLFTTQAGGGPLPNPLTLNIALSYATADHPDLSLADAQLANALSRKLQVKTANDIEAYIELAPFMVIPNLEDDFTNDSYARLSVSKKLYDFGYSQSLEDSANEDVSSQQSLASETRNQHYITIMQHYFNVILADLYFAAIDEKMTSLYVKYDKLLERHSLGMVSDVTLHEAQSIYREAADERKVSEKNQYLSRQRLAIALNQPEDLPADLIRPELPRVEQDVPDLDNLLSTALSNNLTIIALQHALLADKAALQAAKQEHGPSLMADLELNQYERDRFGRNTASVGVTLRIPFANGGRSQGEIAYASSELAASQARYDRAKYALRQQLADLVSQLEILKFKRVSDRQRLDSRALTLDKNRAQYELEMQTTLGSSMADYTEAEWLSAKNDFQVAIIWAQIDALTGKKLYQQKDK